MVPERVRQAMAKPVLSHRGPEFTALLRHTEEQLQSLMGTRNRVFFFSSSGTGMMEATLDVPWGCAPDPAEIARRVASVNYRAVVVVHNESSTGVVADLATIGAAVRDSPALLIVDSVSGLGGIEMRQDEWGIDILLSASQKCLMCPPGGGVVSVSPKAWKVLDRANGLPRFYWDFRKARTSADKMETPFTTPVSLVCGMHEALAMIEEE